MNWIACLRHSCDRCPAQYGDEFRIGTLTIRVCDDCRRELNRVMLDWPERNELRHSELAHDFMRAALGAGLRMKYNDPCAAVATHVKREVALGKRLDAWLDEPKAKGTKENTTNV